MLAIPGTDRREDGQQKAKYGLASVPSGNIGTSPHFNLQSLASSKGNATSNLRLRTP